MITRTEDGDRKGIILFDFGGTLEADGVPWSARFHTAYRTAGGRLPYPEFATLFTESDRQLAAFPPVRSMGFRAMLDVQADLLSALCAAAGDGFDLAPVAADVHAGALQVARRNRGILERLAATWRLGVVSNFTGNLETCLVELHLRAPFAIVCDSAVVGVSKPDPRIFEIALARLSADPSDAWMVGDNPMADLVPAAGLGLRTCWLAPPTDDRALPPGIPTARIASLTAFPAILDVPCTV
jgi:FMN phosphatase YigB (HAD superfamily)